LLALLIAAAPGVARAAARPDSDREHFRAGERIAAAITVATGVPISPLLGASALTAYRWWTTPPERRTELPFYAHPAFWGTGLALALLFAANTTIAGLIPGLKKPMDFVEHYENQVSALLASPLVLLEVRRIVEGLPAWTSPAAPAALPPAAALGSVGAGALHWIGLVGGGALVLLMFGTVFVAFHAIQVLIALSPSALLDLLLRSFRFSFLVLVGLAAGTHPYVGAAFGLLVLLAASLVAGWAMRLTVLGSVFARDLLFPPAGLDFSSGVRAFAGRGLAGPPLRSYGRLEREPSGARRFVWRRWLIGPRRRVDLAPAESIAVRRGALSPTLFRLGGIREPSVARLPPRYKGSEERVAESVGAVEVQDGRLVRGLRAAWRWLREEVLGLGGSGEAAA